MTNHWNTQWRDGHRDIERQFEWNGREWIDWSESHPAMAARLWPCVLDLLTSNSEDADSTASQLMFYAKIAESDDQFNDLVAADSGLSEAIGRTGEALTSPAARRERDEGLR